MKPVFPFCDIIYEKEGDGYVNKQSSRTKLFHLQKHKGNIIVPGGAIYEDELVYVGHVHWDSEETYLGYVMIDIKRHVPGLAELTDEEAKAFGLITSRVSKALKESEGAEHIYTFVSGNGVPHMHMHIIPRYPNTPKEFWSPSEIANGLAHHMVTQRKSKTMRKNTRVYGE